MRGAGLIAASLLIAPAMPAPAQPAVARSIPIGFAPPTDRTLRYTIEQHRPIAGRVSLFRSTRDLRFERVGEGYVLRATLRALDSDAAPAGAEPFRAALSPLIGIELAFQLDGSGRIVALDNMAAVWAAVQRGLANMIAGFAPETPRHRAARSVLTLLSGLSPDGRLAVLAGEFQSIFLFSGSVVEEGAGRGLRTTAGSPLGRPVPVDGVLTLTGRTGDRLTLDETLSGEGVAVTMHYRLSARTGLVEEQVRILAVGPDALTETRRLTSFID